jgi:hypothetical protein
MRIPAALIAATFLGSALLVHAQERKESSGSAVYKVELEVRDSSGGEAQPSQHFSMLVDESRKAIFQAATRVPVATGSPQHVDVGVKIECSVHESDGKATLRGGIELTSITGYVSLSAISQPIIGQRKMAFNATVELATPTVIVDDRNALAAAPVSLGRTDAPVSGIPTNSKVVATSHQLEATVTRMN